MERAARPAPAAEIPAMSFPSLPPHRQMPTSGSNDKTIKLWEMASARELRTVNGYSGDVHWG